MLYTQRLLSAIAFATRVHQVDQDQRRKATGLPYIIHPLTVMALVTRVTINEDVLMAAVLHDTMEDAPLAHPVTEEMLAKEFGSAAAKLVAELSEQKRGPDGAKLPWLDRKTAALAHVPGMSPSAKIIKTADAIANIADMIAQYKISGEAMFEGFGGTRELQLWFFGDLVLLLCEAGNPLCVELSEQWLAFTKQLAPALPV